MIRGKSLLVAAMGMCLAAPALHAQQKENPCRGVVREDRLESLSAVYYRDGKPPAEASAAEVDRLQDLKEEPGHEDRAAFLEKAFKRDKSLQALAFRDSDGDGIMDYRIGKCGEFRENDP